MNEYTLLHVDDDEATRELLAVYMEEEIDRANFDIIEAQDADEAFSIIESETIDCVICDNQMPGMNGIEMISKLNRSHPELPTILMTNKGSSELANKAIKTGATDYVRKGGKSGEQYEVLANRVINAVEQQRGQKAQDRLTQSSTIITNIYRRINNSEDMPFNEKLKEVLEIGREKLDYPIGYVTKAYPNEFEIIAAIGDSENIQEGMTASKETSVCAKTIEDEEPLIHTDITDADFLKKCPKSVNFHSYTGAPIISNGEIYGTVCFRNYKPKTIHQEHHAIVINTIANWLGYKIERNQYEQELKRQIDRLEEFTSVVSHDLRSPLNAAKGRAELISMKHDIDHADKVQSSLDRMENIIQDTLTLARQGKTVDQTEEVELCDIVNEVVETMEFGDSEVTIENTFSFQCDKSKTKHIFENLFRNAMEHSDKPVEIRVGEKQSMLTSTRQNESKTATFYIEDSGKGIPENIKDDMFKPGESTNTNGTGFGLSIVKRITEAHGWKIDVKDSFDGGARFEFSNVIK